MDLINTLLTGLGLSSAAGLNAYIPLLVTGLLGRYTNLVTLSEPYDLLERPLVLVTLGLLLVIEMLADKIAAVDTVNDLIHTLVRPTAGAILFVASAGGPGEIDPVFAAILGLLSAGGVHAAKATARPFVTATTGGLGNPIVSLIEDVISVVVALLAVLIPIVGLLVAAAVVVWYVRRRRRRPAASTS